MVVTDGPPGHGMVLDLKIVLSGVCRCRAQVLLTEAGVTLMYLGPDVLMPLASAFAAVAGVVLMFWRKIASATRSVGQFVSRAGRRS